VRRRGKLWTSSGRSDAFRIYVYVSDLVMLIMNDLPSFLSHCLPPALLTAGLFSPPDSSHHHILSPLNLCAPL